MRNAGTIQPWLSALRDSARDVITTSLGCEDAEIAAQFQAAPHDTPGAYLPIVGSGASMFVGWMAAARERLALARAFLGMTEADELDEGDVADALGELVNILGGGVKRRMLAHVAGLAIGLPFYAGGAMRLCGGVPGLGARVRCGAVESHIVFYSAGADVNPGAAGHA